MVFSGVVPRFLAVDGGFCWSCVVAQVSSENSKDRWMGWRLCVGRWNMVVFGGLLVVRERERES